MTVPSQADIKKRKVNRDKLAKKITDDGHLKENELVRIVRKAIDSAWMTAANKLVFFEDKVVPDLDPGSRTKWLIECNICHKMFKVTDVNVDHRIGEFPCTNRDEFMTYLVSRLDVGFGDLQILCVDIPKKDHVGCHQIKTLSERMGITFEDARLEKKVIAICKQPAKLIDAYLAENGVTGYARNKDARRDAVRRVLKEQLLKEKENVE